MKRLLALIIIAICGCSAKPAVDPSRAASNAQFLSDYHAAAAATADAAGDHELSAAHRRAAQGK